MKTTEQRLADLQAIKNGTYKPEVYKEIETVKSSEILSNDKISAEDACYIELGITNKAQILEDEKEAAWALTLSPEDKALYKMGVLKYESIKNQ